MLWQAHAHHNFVLERKRRLRAIQRAFERAQDELAECLDLAGQVYMFGHGVTGQFNHGPALQEHSYIAPLGRYRGANEFRRYPYDLQGQQVSVKGEHDSSGATKEEKILMMKLLLKQANVLDTYTKRYESNCKHMD